MSALTDRIAAEHRDALYIDTADAIICKGCGEIIFDISHHIANVTEAAVRKQVAQEIRAQRDQFQLDDLEKVAYDTAARIADGVTP